MLPQFKSWIDAERVCSAKIRAAGVGDDAHVRLNLVSLSSA